MLGADGAIAIQCDREWIVLKSLVPGFEFAPRIVDVVATDGALWFASAIGVYEYRDRRLALHRTSHAVRALCAAGDVLWLAMPQGLARLSAGEVSIVLPGDVTCVSRDRDGTPWFVVDGVLRSFGSG